MAPRPLPPSQIRPPSTSIGIQEGHGGSSDGEHEYAVQLVDQWRAALVERLPDPATRSFELVLTEPSPQNVVQAVQHLSAVDPMTRASVYDVLSSLIANDYLSESNELSIAIQEIRSNLRDTGTRSESSSAAVRAKER